MRLLFLGSGAFGLPTLKHLATTHEIVGVVSQPARPAGRGGRLTQTPIAEWAAQHLHAVPLLTPENINEPQWITRVRDLVGPRWARADAWVVIAFGQKLSPPLLDDVFAINLHASLLPRWRGAAPINAAMLAGDAATGNSVITLADRMDAGLVLGQSDRAIFPAMTAGELHDALSIDGPPVVSRVLDDQLRGSLHARPQDESLVTKARKLSKADGWIDLTQSAELCRRRINGLSPWPGVAARLDGQELKLLRAQVAPAVAAHGGGGAGTPGSLADPELGIVACGEGTALMLIEVQPPGKKPMNWQEFARGRRPAVTTASTLISGAPGSC
ncbi:MAG: methionyl-tRNA formyltransferase [Phycisphaerales bacterium]|nr:methionyl-tRNA formyltransferase [Phycisphaerales bacterium]